MLSCYPPPPIRPTSSTFILARMIDLRLLTLDQRRELCVEAERRARAGEAPVAIRAALGLSKGSYSQWAKLFGFRQCDLYPGKVRVGAPPLHPPGPGGYVASGRVFRGLPPRGAPGARQELDTLDSAAEVLDAVKAARAAGDLRHADRLLIAWRTRARRARDLAALEAEVEADLNAYTDDQLQADLFALVEALNAPADAQDRAMDSDNLTNDELRAEIEAIIEESNSKWV